MIFEFFGLFEGLSLGCSLTIFGWLEWLSLLKLFLTFWGFLFDFRVDFGWFFRGVNFGFIFSSKSVIILGY